MVAQRKLDYLRQEDERSFLMRMLVIFGHPTTIEHIELNDGNLSITTGDLERLGDIIRNIINSGFDTRYLP